MCFARRRFEFHRTAACKVKAQHARKFCKILRLKGRGDDDLPVRLEELVQPFCQPFGVSLVGGKQVDIVYKQRLRLIEQFFKFAYGVFMSISSAPFAMASRASSALTVGVVEPSGKPITVQTFTPEPLSRSAARCT